MELRYGVNPEQRATASLDDKDSPLRLLSGTPSYINVLDALNSWQLVRDVSEALTRPAAAAFKHVSPAGAALAGDIDHVIEATWGLAATDLTPIASAYVRARDCDPKSCFGDFVAVSDPVDRCLAEFLVRVPSDGIVAPGFEPGVVGMLAPKKHNRFLVFEADPGYAPPTWEQREVFGVRLAQETRRLAITTEVVAAGTEESLPPDAVADLVLAMITVRYAQSNSVAYARSGMVLGVGAGQQSRVDCTKLAGSKVDMWWLRRHAQVRSLAFKADVRRQDRINWRTRYIEDDMSANELERFVDALTARPPFLGAQDRVSWMSTLDDVVFASDGYIPFRDNVDQAARHGVRYLAHPGGSVRTPEVEQAAAEHGIRLISTGVRLFHH